MIVQELCEQLVEFLEFSSYYFRYRYIHWCFIDIRIFPTHYNVYPKTVDYILGDDDLKILRTSNENLDKFIFN